MSTEAVTGTVLAFLAAGAGAGTLLAAFGAAVLRAGAAAGAAVAVVLDAAFFAAGAGLSGFADF
ncbi:hypothetical protein GCM10023090_02590 [Acidovorax lacteus]|uniref:Uncharacterized protein n=1 Tax=Acidovorax lacteus TaxID=1924988 RepID=A0ABP8KWE6_9BURK